MNTIAIAARMNDKQFVIGASWPTVKTLKALAQHKLGGLKRRINKAAFNVAMAIIPMPQCAVA